MNKQKKTVRALCLVLAFLMVAGVATIGISLIVEALRPEPETQQTDSHAGHNH